MGFQLKVTQRRGQRAKLARPRNAQGCQRLPHSRIQNMPPSHEAWQTERGSAGERFECAQRNFLQFTDVAIAGLRLRLLILMAAKSRTRGPPVSRLS